VITYLLLYGAYLVYFSLLLGGRFNASPFTIGIFISILGIFVVVTSFQVGRLSKRFSLMSLIMVAFVIYAFAVVIVPVMSNIWLCLIPTILFGIAHGLNLPGQQVIATSMVPLEHRASFMSVQGTMIMVGMTIGPPIMSLVFSLTSLNVVFLVSAVFALIIPIMATIIGKKKLPAL
jgi:predicted MFS family arabinose efflux permease